VSRSSAPRHIVGPLLFFFLSLPVVSLLCDAVWVLLSAVSNAGCANIRVRCFFSGTSASACLDLWYFLDVFPLNSFTFGVFVLAFSRPPGRFLDCSGSRGFRWEFCRTAIHCPVISGRFVDGHRFLPVVRGEFYGFTPLGIFCSFACSDLEFQREMHVVSKTRETSIGPCRGLWLGSIPFYCGVVLSVIGGQLLYSTLSYTLLRISNATGWVMLKFASRDVCLAGVTMRVCTWLLWY